MTTVRVRRTRVEKRQDFIDYNFAYKDHFQQELFCDYTIVTFNAHNLYYLAIFEYNNVKPYIYYHFREEKLRTDYIQKQKEYYQRVYLQKQIEEEKKEREKDLIQVGTIFYSSWGYEQTNINFYIVVERKGDWIKLQEIESIKYYTEGFNDRGTCKPNIDMKKGNIFRKKLSLRGIKVNSFEFLSVYSGNSLRWSSYA